MPLVSRGSIYRTKGCQNWFTKFYVDRELRRETTRTPDREQALAVLAQRIADAREGRTEPQPVTFEEMHRLLILDYGLKKNRTDPNRHVRRLAEFFGGMKGAEITEERIGEYSKRRLERDGMKPATLRRELAILSRMLHLVSNRLPRLPLIPYPRIENARQGYFEERDLLAVLPHLPSHARNLVEFLYLTGWRSSEAFRLQWPDIDWKREVVRLRQSKNREPRIFPFEYHPRLRELLRRQREEVSRWEGEHSQICLSVFHWRGQPIQKLRRSWRNACAAAGISNALLHDFRRTAVRNLILAGVRQSIAMKITGHKTGAGFGRYLIVDDEMLAQAAGQVASYLEGEKAIATRKPVFAPGETMPRPPGK